MIIHNRGELDELAGEKKTIIYDEDIIFEFMPGIDALKKVVSDRIFFKTKKEDGTDCYFQVNGELNVNLLDVKELLE